MRFLGTDGAAKLGLAPQNSVHQLKRLLGKRFADPAVQADIARLPFKVRHGLPVPVCPAAAAFAACLLRKRKGVWLEGAPSLPSHAGVEDEASLSCDGVVMEGVHTCIHIRRTRPACMHTPLSHTCMETTGAAAAPQRNPSRCLPAAQVTEGEAGGCLIHVMYCNEPSTFTPEQVMAMILVDCKHIAEEEAGVTVTDCAIAVPTYYAEAERYAMLNAAAIAGVKCLRLINENTATALAYGIYKTDLPETEAVHVAFVDVGHSSTQVGARRGEQLGRRRGAGQRARAHQPQLQLPRYARRRAQLGTGLPRMPPSLNAFSGLPLQSVGGIDGDRCAESSICSACAASGATR